MLDLDFTVQRGHFHLSVKEQLQSPITGLLGNSGCGKTTLLAAIAGLLTPQHGRIVLHGTTLFDSNQGISLPTHQRQVGLVFQQGQLFPHLTVRHNLLYGYNQIKPQQRHFSLSSIVELLEIGHLLKRHPLQLSGGEQQRVALGRAILYSPQLLLLDEPLSSLDARLKEQILPFLLRIRDEVKIPMLYVTHAPEEIRYLTSQCLLIKDGTISSYQNV